MNDPNPIQIILEFTECKSCAAKPGSPTLCTSCYLNRTVIERLQIRIKELEDSLKLIPKAVRKIYEIG